MISGHTHQNEPSASAQEHRASFLGRQAVYATVWVIAALAIFAFAMVMTTLRRGPHPAKLVAPSTGHASSQGNASDPSGMPAPLNPHDLYAADRPGLLSPAVKAFPSLVYVPNSKSDSLDVIDPATFRIVAHYPVGRLPQHVVPSWDLKTLWVTNNASNSLTPIDPATGKLGTPVPVDDPYNMYFTPDGRYAIVVAERLHRLDFRDPHTMTLVRSLPVPCQGVDHMDFSADGTFLLASCEFSGQMLKVDLDHQQLTQVVTLPRGALPQDVRLSPDGQIFYVADKAAGGIYELDAGSLTVKAFLPTGADAHGLYISRDSRVLYVSNRGTGTVSVIDLTTRQITATWRIPGGGSPDMGGISADGTTLWLAGRYHQEVYALDTTTGALRARIKVGVEPHGMSIYPQPGRYSLGHTGVFR